MTTFILLILSMLPFAILLGVLVHSVMETRNRQFQ